MNVGLFEDAGYERLLPLTWLRAPFELRCGRDRLIDKVQTHLGTDAARLWVRASIAEVVAERIKLTQTIPGADWCLLNARALLAGNLTPPRAGVAWYQNGTLLAAGVADTDIESISAEMFLDETALADWAAGFRHEPGPETLRLIEYPWDLPHANGAEIERQCRAGGVHEGVIHPSAHLLNPSEIHIAAGCQIKPGVVLDAERGPIHLEGGVTVEPNAVIYGPCYIGRDSVVRPTAVVRENTSIGPQCRVGGEIAHSIIHGLSNKQHDGFLGHSYVAEWVNLGAGTITSNLKNTYGTIRVSINGVGVETGRHYVGTTFGDHVKTGIGTVLPTGGVIGVASNVFTHQVPKFVPSFAWLTAAGMTSYRIDKAILIARTVMERRDVHLTDAEERLLRATAETAPDVEAAGWP